MFDRQKNKNSIRVIIIGGGYAGLSALAKLRTQCPAAEITLLDPRPSHVKLTRLHESIRESSPGVHLPFGLIENRFKIRHIAEEVDIHAGALESWNQARSITISKNQTIDFDYLIIALGSGVQRVGLEQSSHILTLSDFIETPGSKLIADQLDRRGNQSPWITVVGSGPTGIQFLFEIADFIRMHRLNWKLRLVDAWSRPLQKFPESISNYVLARLDDWDISYIPRHLMLVQQEKSIILEERETQSRLELPSAVTLYFAGKTTSHRLLSNWFGQVKLKGKTLHRIFTAGDCSIFKGPGSNSLSAQSAVRKGRLVAENILRHRSPLSLMKPYLHRELGYVVSLGPRDAIGWVASPKNIIAGPAALTIQEVVESQYDLLLTGTDTFAL